MMCFAGCEEKGNEITTEKNGNTDENVEITEANILGKWSCYKDVDYYEGEEEVHEYGSGEYEFFTFNADGTLKQEIKTEEYTSTHSGTWKLNGTKLTIYGDGTCSIKKLTTKEMVWRWEEEGDWGERYLRKI